MNQYLTLGSLFDGIGGFPLAASRSGIRTLWLSEIEPFPIRVTEKRFPDAIQLGDVHGVKGAKIPPVDIITFGSPCQNLSIAGKQAGLQGEQSSLFFEAVRIIKEMRNATNQQYPRWAVWENVPNALSCSHGQDFREVLRSLIQIADEHADVPLPEKWLPAGEIMGNSYSLAWRVLDASKGWGVAQRRKRIFLVLDLGGACAGPVLFESEGQSGFAPSGGETRQSHPGSAEGGADPAGALCLNDQGGKRMDVSFGVTNTLRAEVKGHPPLVMDKPIASSAGFCTEHSADSRGIGYAEEESPTLRAGVVPGVAIEFNPTDTRLKIKEDGIVQTLTARTGTGGNNVPLVGQPLAYGIGSYHSEGMLSENPQSGIYEADTSRTLDTSGGTPVCQQGGMAVVEKVFAMNVGLFNSGEDVSPPILARDYKDPPVVTEPEYLVRRLTPLECLRLQGYPDDWLSALGEAHPTQDEIDRWERIFTIWNGIQGVRPRTRKQIIKWLRNPNTDAAEYKAIGNSVAVPCVHFVLAGIVWAAGKESDNGSEDQPVLGLGQK